jgi:hypothetical protein
MYALLHKRSQHMVRTEFILLNILNNIFHHSFWMQVNLELRLYAMYGRKKKILAVLVSLISAEAIVMGVLFGMTRTNLIGA